MATVVRTTTGVRVLPGLGGTLAVQNASLIGNIKDLVKKGAGAAVDEARRRLAGQGGGGGPTLPPAPPMTFRPPPTNFTQSGGLCPVGFVFRNGRCEQVGMVGTIERLLPGGQTGTLMDEAGEAVLGAFGLPAIIPRQVGVIEDREGREGPILRCPTGLVLGKDSLCYPKAAIPRQFRKNPPAKKPPLTVTDANAIRRAASAKNRVKKLAGDVGFSCVTKGGSRRRT